MSTFVRETFQNKYTGSQPHGANLSQEFIREEDPGLMDVINVVDKLGHADGTADTLKPILTQAWDLTHPKEEKKEENKEEAKAKCDAACDPYGYYKFHPDIYNQIYQVPAQAAQPQQAPVTSYASSHAQVVQQPVAQLQPMVQQPVTLQPVAQQAFVPTQTHVEPVVASAPQVNSEDQLPEQSFDQPVVTYGSGYGQSTVGTALPTQSVTTSKNEHTVHIDLPTVQQQGLHTITNPYLHMGQTQPMPQVAVAAQHPHPSYVYYQPYPQHHPYHHHHNQHQHHYHRRRWF